VKMSCLAYIVDVTVERQSVVYCHTETLYCSCNRNSNVGDCIEFWVRVGLRFTLRLGLELLTVKDMLRVRIRVAVKVSILVTVTFRLPYCKFKDCRMNRIRRSPYGSVRE